MAESLIEKTENAGSETGSEESLPLSDVDSSQATSRPVSKREKKRLLKDERWRELKEKRREKRKEKRKALDAKRKEEGKPSHSSQRRKLLKRQSSLTASMSQTVAIDLSFDHLMAEKDISKLVKQIQHSYACNRRAVHPLDLHLTSFGTKTEARLEDAIEGYQNWHVHFHRQPYVELFDKERLVYLTSESDNVLEELDMSKVYIIGGLVDHNHHKGLCHKQAVEAGIEHAQLPIKEHIKLASRRVLTVNHVFEILLAFEETKDWLESFRRVIPGRKGVEELPKILSCEKPT